jgi:Tol biopolymer transport system component
MNPDGTFQIQLTKNRQNSSATWSRDGSKIAFQRGDSPSHVEIFVMNADGSGLAQLTNNASESSFNPTWSPDGTRIAFGRGADGATTSEIYVMNADGSEVVNLTRSGGFNASPAWSPDGLKIAFGSVRNGSSEDIWVMDTNGDNQTNLTSGFVVANDGSPSQERWPAWSPDSTRIAFYTNSDGCGGCATPFVFHIYLMNSNGTSPSALTTRTSVGDTTTQIFDFTPTWSPDGTKIAFASNRSGNGNDIYVMDADQAEDVLNGLNIPRNVSNLGAGHSPLRPSWGTAPPCVRKNCR